jgi:phosphoribosylformylglycinamidine synthase
VRVRIDVRLKPAVLDPQGAAVGDGLKRLGFEEVSAVRVGKVIELDLGGEGLDDDTARERISVMCEKLLANPVIEDYEITLLSGDD